ncbi:MAG: tetratricopeptide repeat-containing diguanylate cyclase, partial [Photobacterium frigidiphilum]|uniref:tetratricopeptide repeat-containing diguanylate cyclase n=1 Tax=Photobacterium frigidiphilum TaxID=264736 RepID=UPI00300339BB
SWMMGEATLEQAIEYIEVGEYEQAFQHITLVIEIAKQEKYQHLLARAMKWRANIYVESSAYPKAMDDYRSALEIFTQQKDQIQQARVLSNISTVYFRLEEWQKADKYSRHAFKLIDNVNFDNPGVKAMLHINAGIIAKNLNKPELESEHLRAAVKLSTEKGSRYAQIYALSNLVTLLLQEDELETAIASAQRCLVLANEVSDKVGMVYCNEAIAETYLKQQRYNEALALSEKVLAQFEVMNNRKKSILLKEFISKIHEERGDYKQALVFYKQYTDEGKDYLFDERRKQLFALQESYEAKNKETEIELLTYENALKTARISEQQTLDKLWMLVALIFCLVIYILYRRYMSVAKTNFSLRRSNATLVSQSLEDPLTGLHNRRYLEQWLETAEQNRQLDTYDLVVLVVDVDYFKKVNDSYGHEIGDNVLTEVAHRLKDNARSHNDLVIRWGGEEFVLVLALTPESDIEFVLNRLRESIASTPIISADHELTVTVSIGAIGGIKGDVIYEQWDTLLTQADKALYNAKSSGRNCVKLVGTY